MKGLKTCRDVQKFKAQRRKALLKDYAAGKVQLQDFTLAAANTLKHQPLDLSRVEILDHEIDPEQ